MIFLIIQLSTNVKFVKNGGISSKYMLLCVRIFELTSELLYLSEKLNMLSALFLSARCYLCRPTCYFLRLSGFSVRLSGFSVRLFGFSVRLSGFSVRLFGFSVRLFKWFSRMKLWSDVMNLGISHTLHLSAKQFVVFL